MGLTLEVVSQVLEPGHNVVPEFDKDARFNEVWWHHGSAKSPVAYCRVLDQEVEVARAKILPRSRAYSAYTTWVCPPGGATEIDLIEVRVDLRRCGEGYGSRAVEAIGRRYGLPMMAMSLDDEADGFWASLGWQPHRHPEDDAYRTLFTSV